jgi:hypothetical protein
MTLEERRAYRNESAARHRKKRHPKFQMSLELQARPTKTCGLCGLDFPNTRKHFRHPTVRYNTKGACLSCERIKARRRGFAKRFGLTPEQYDEQVRGKVCLICGGNDRLVLDHCHKSGRIRGVLCSNCNSALGMFGDDPKRLLSAVEYLRDDLC